MQQRCPPKASKIAVCVKESLTPSTDGKEEIGYKALEGIVDRWISREVKWAEVKRVKILGLNEIALKKGHRDFVVIVTARSAEGEVGVLAELPDRKKHTVRKFLEALPKRVKRTIRTVCTELPRSLRAVLLCALAPVA